MKTTRHRKNHSKVNTMTFSETRKRLYEKCKNHDSREVSSSKIGQIYILSAYQELMLTLQKNF